MARAPIVLFPGSDGSHTINISYRVNDHVSTSHVITASVLLPVAQISKQDDSEGSILFVL